MVSGASGQRCVDSADGSHALPTLEGNKQLTRVTAEEPQVRQV